MRATVLANEGKPTWRIFPPEDLDDFFSCLADFLASVTASSGHTLIGSPHHKIWPIRMLWKVEISHCTGMEPFLYTTRWAAYWRYCPANYNRGQYYAQIIRSGKLEARLFFFSNFKGTPSQKEHKIIFSSLMINKMALSEKSDATVLFSAVRYTLCDTYIDFPGQFRKVNFLKLSGVNPSYRARARADCHIPELMKFW
jgi:hypothetical protein